MPEKRELDAEALLSAMIVRSEAVIGLIEDGESCYEYVADQEPEDGCYMGNAVSPDAEEVDELMAVLEEAKALLGDAAGGAHAATPLEAENDRLRSVLKQLAADFCWEACEMPADKVLTCEHPCRAMRAAFDLLQPKEVPAHA